MKLIRGIHNLTSCKLPSCILTIGNFDGVHKGHEAVIGQLKAQSKRLSLPTAVMIFEPQPVEFFSPQNAPPRLARLRDKIMALSQLDIDYLICLQFNQELAQMTPETFIDYILCDLCQVKQMVIGDDFRFGKQRQGDFALLQQQGKLKGFGVQQTETLESGDERISSTRIRILLAQGKLSEAQQLFSRPYSLSGKITHGKKLGRELGFPTININMAPHPMALHGIFAVWVKGLDNHPLAGVASIGTRPTVNGTGTILEVYILNFSSQVYGRTVEIEFLDKIRNEERFDSLNALTVQINQDIQQATQFFQNLNSPETK